MEYKTLIETTKWTGKDANTPNHTYFVANDKMVGYINAVTGDTTFFAKPLTFNKRGRTFKEIK